MEEKERRRTVAPTPRRFCVRFQIWPERKFETWESFQKEQTRGEQFFCEPLGGFTAASLPHREQQRTPKSIQHPWKPLLLLKNDCSLQLWRPLVPRDQLWHQDKGWDWRLLSLDSLRLRSYLFFSHCFIFLFFSPLLRCILIKQTPQPSVLDLVLCSGSRLWAGSCFPALTVRVRPRGAGVWLWVFVIVGVLCQVLLPYFPVGLSEAGQQSVVVEITPLLTEGVLGRESGRRGGV